MRTRRSLVPSAEAASLMGLCASLLAIALHHAPASACDCFSFQEFEDADHILEGVVVCRDNEHDEALCPERVDYYRGVVLRVTRIWKGQAPALIRVSDSISSCGQNMQPGEEWFVMTNSRECGGEYTISACSNSRRIEYAGDLIEELTQSLDGGVPPDLAELDAGEAAPTCGAAQPADGGPGVPLDRGDEGAVECSCALTSTSSERMGVFVGTIVYALTAGSRRRRSKGEPGGAKGR